MQLCSFVHVNIGRYNIKLLEYIIKKIIKNHVMSAGLASEKGQLNVIESLIKKGSDIYTNYAD